MLHPDLSKVQRKSPVAGSVQVFRSAEARLAEAVNLALAIDLTVAHEEVVRLAAPRPSSLFGKGTIDRIGALVGQESIELVVIDSSLTPVQQRNLERSWDCKVIDRTGLILEIFGERARTSEGKLQVELAALEYQRSRLVRSWTHLERQRGGYGFLGGPGESQLEIDRRLISERTARIRQNLEQVRSRRELHRSARRRVPYPIVALVGYTNAGKSSLFNRLTAAQVYAKDLLFATLDPTMRRLELPDREIVIISDTVGFISDLPTGLVAAFRATLEEVLEAEIILHVRDIAHPDSEAQRSDVIDVLSDLGIEESDPRIVEILNKVDLLRAPQKAVVKRQCAGKESYIATSAATGEGIAELLEMLARRRRSTRELLRLSVPLTDGATIAWLYEHGEVVERRDDDSQAFLEVRLSTSDKARLERRRQAAARLLA